VGALACSSATQSGEIFWGVNSKQNPPPPVIGHYVVYTRAVLVAVFALQLALNGRVCGLAPPTFQRSSERVELFSSFNFWRNSLCYNIRRKKRGIFLQTFNSNQQSAKLDHCLLITFTFLLMISTFLFSF
jgi:hypothetical protein